MPERSNFLKFDSLQARIWLAVGILALVSAGLAIAAHHFVSLFLPDSIFPAIATAVPVFIVAPIAGYWLVKNILGPIENVSLLAKSLERSPSASVPKTSGATETDEILYSLHRNSRQTTTLIMLMDDVAAGKTETALTPLEHADKLCNSFQRLVSKVTNSIDAKNDLDSIQNQLERLRSDIQGIKHGSLEISIRTNDHEAINDVSDSVTSLIDRTNKIASRIRSTSTEARPLLSRISNGLHVGITKIEADTRQHEKAIAALRTCNTSFTNISADVSSATDSIRSLIEERNARHGHNAEAGQELTKLRLKLADTQKVLSVLRERMEQIGRASRTAGEIARRSNMIAVNTSIQSQAGPHIRMGVSMVSEEITLLAERSTKLSRSLASLEEQLLNDLSPVETALKEIEANIFQLAQKYVQTRTELTDSASGQEYLSLPDKLAAVIRTPQNEVAGIIENHTENSSQAEVALRESERSAAEMSRLLDELSITIADIGMSALNIPAMPATDNLPVATNGHYSMENSSDSEFES